MKTTLITIRLLETLKKLNWKAENAVLSNNILNFNFIDSNSLTISRNTSDIKLSLSVECDCTDAISETSYILNLAQLFKIIKKVKTDQITFDFIDNKCQLSFGSMRAKIDIFDIDNCHSEESTFSEVIVCGLSNSDKVTKAIKHILPFTGYNELRRNLMGINFQIKNRELHLIGANAYQIQKNKVDCFLPDEDTTLNFTLPNVASKVLSDINYTSCNIFVNDSHVQFKGFDFELTCRVIESEYPNLDMLFSHNCTPYQINTKTLLAGIDSLFNFLDNDKNAVLTLEYVNGGLVFSSVDNEFSFEYDGSENVLPDNDFSIGLNCYFLRESLKHHKHNETLLIYNSNSVQPFILENGSQVNVLMPVRIKKVIR